MKTMVAEDSAFYDPPKQTRSVIVCWKKVEHWADTLFEWVRIRIGVGPLITDV